MSPMPGAFSWSCPRSANAPCFGSRARTHPDRAVNVAEVNSCERSGETGRGGSGVLLVILRRFLYNSGPESSPEYSPLLWSFPRSPPVTWAYASPRLRPRRLVSRPPRMPWLASARAWCWRRRRRWWDRLRRPSSSASPFASSMLAARTMDGKRCMSFGFSRSSRAPCSMVCSTGCHGATLSAVIESLPASERMTLRQIPDASR
mmetsp:Transcript_412/g.1377  ORF Transcript_412/g.1377 Transcript_412/m.1377 type:complete len:204 (+) Transcript_412:167-778(+)